MNWRRAVSTMHDMVARHGVSGCALVDPETGWIWHTCGPQPHGPEIWEAAVDYWRLQERQRGCFEPIGALSAVVLYHREAALAVLPCCDEPRLHMVCVAPHGRVDWRAWQRAVRDLGSMLQAPTATGAA